MKLKGVRAFDVFRGGFFDDDPGFAASQRLQRPFEFFLFNSGGLAHLLKSEFLTLVEVQQNERLKKRHLSWGDGPLESIPLQWNPAIAHPLINKTHQKNIQFFFLEGILYSSMIRQYKKPHYESQIWLIFDRATIASVEKLTRWRAVFWKQYDSKYHNHMFFRIPISCSIARQNIKVIRPT